MKLKALTLATLFSLSSIACDVCGTSLNLGSTEIYPGVLSNYILLRSKLSSFQSTHNYSSGNQFTDEYFYSTELEGRYKIAPSFYVTGTLPYVVNSSMNQNESILSTGIGDARVKFEYALNFDKNIEQEKTGLLLSGVTFKLPTGKFENRIDETYIQRSLLPGTGSLDLAFHSSFIRRVKNLGFIISGFYSFNTKNKLSYEKGNVASMEVNGFLRKDLKNNTFLFSGGINFYHAQKDYDHTFETETISSGGYSLSPTLSINYIYKKLNLGIVGKKAIIQQFSQGNSKNLFQTEFYLRYNLKTKK